jgi:hypothetical protein
MMQCFIEIEFYLNIIPNYVPKNCVCNKNTLLNKSPSL